MKYGLGFSLIELMISLTLSTVLLSELITIYCAAEKNTAYVNALSTLQENSIMATAFLRNAIKTAGFIGCAHWTTSFPLTNQTDLSFEANQKIIKINSGSFTVKHASLLGATLLRNMRSLKTLYTSAAVDFKAGDILLISDCQRADIFLVDAVVHLMDQSQKITLQTPLSFLYQADAVVRKIEVETFYIKDNALVVKPFNHQSQELVEGINAMQVTMNTHAGEIKGVAITLNLNQDSLEKKWNLYAALRN